MKMEELINPNDKPEIVERVKKVVNKFKSVDGLQNCLLKFGQFLPHKDDPSLTQISLIEAQVKEYYFTVMAAKLQPIDTKSQECAISYSLEDLRKELCSYLNSKDLKFYFESRVQDKDFLIKILFTILPTSNILKIPNDAKARLLEQIRLSQQTSARNKQNGVRIELMTLKEKQTLGELHIKLSTSGYQLPKLTTIEMEYLHQVLNSDIFSIQLTKVKKQSKSSSTLNSRLISDFFFNFGKIQNVNWGIDEIGELDLEWATNILHTLWPSCILFTEKSLYLDNVPDFTLKVTNPVEPFMIDTDSLMMGRKHILVMQSIYDLLKL